MIRRKYRKYRGVSSKSFLAVFAVNAMVVAVNFLLFGWILNHITLKERYMGFFSYREIVLCFLFSLLVSGVIDYFLLLRPMLELEEFVLDFIHMKEQRRWDTAQDITAEDSLETVIRKLVRQQKLIYEKERIEEKQRQKAELYALQSQIDPHFLYNALDSIRGYALLHDMDEISDITEALSRVFRNMISDKHEMLPLRQELDNINNYMKIQQFRFNNKFHYSCEVDEELLDRYMIPRMVLQPLVENSITHGLEGKLDGGWVKVKAYVTERRFILTVTDNGEGIDEEHLEYLNRAMNMNPVDYHIQENSYHTGIALININQRIKLNFGKQYGLILNSTPNIRTVIEAVLPLTLNRR